VKASKKLQKQFADFKAEFVHLCQAFGGVVNTSRGDRNYTIPTPWGKIHASIREPWGMDMDIYPGDRNRSSTGIFLCADDYGDTLPECWGEWPRPLWKWNIHRSADAGGMYVECCNEALSEFARRLERATGRKECDPAVFSSQILEAA
jgi:hypothetical protein